MLLASFRMRALVADDDRMAALMLRTALERCALDVSVVHDGESALATLSGAEPPSVAVLDWMMPGVDGIDVCRRVRRDNGAQPIYLLLVTGRDSRADLVAGLEAGADDYVTKPFDLNELLARVRVGMRVVSLQASLAQRVAELQAALSAVKRLDGLLPICSYCKRIRTDEDYWEQLEQYVSERSDARFSHGICPACIERVRADFEV
jgi:phosphoserine phosphatase RsbU/P